MVVRSLRGCLAHGDVTNRDGGSADLHAGSEWLEVARGNCPIDAVAVEHVAYRGGHIFHGEEPVANLLGHSLEANLRDALARDKTPDATRLLVFGIVCVALSPLAGHFLVIGVNLRDIHLALLIHLSHRGIFIG